MSSDLKFTRPDSHELRKATLMHRDFKLLGFSVIDSDGKLNEVFQTQAGAAELQKIIGGEVVIVYREAI